MRKYMALGGLILTAASFVAVSAASAATDTGVMNVSATVQITCDVSASNLAFGNITGDGLHTATSTITVDCTGTTATTPTVTVGEGDHFSTTRRMATAGATAYIPYKLTSGTTCTGTITDLSATDTVSLTVTTAPDWSGSVCGQIAAGGDYSTGSYTDTLTVTVDYSL